MTATVDEQATTTVRGACPHDCPDTCAMLVTVEDGRATKVAGDPEHPFTRGGLCVKVNNYQEKTYSPDRVLHPMRRTGPKGSGRFERISWDEALETIATTFRAKIAEHGPETVMPVSYLGTQGILNGLDGRATRSSTGSAPRSPSGPTATPVPAPPTPSTVGATAGVDPESIVHSQLHHHLGLEHDLDEPAPVAVHRGGAEARREGRRASTRCATAPPQRADWYIPIRPGTDGALALAMMHVIIGEGLHDEDYVRDHTVGFDELAERVTQYTPEWASEETGIPAEDIRTLAREYATSRPVDDPDRRRDRAARRGRADGALDRLPARAGRRLAPRRRRAAAAAAVGAPGELARLHPPRDGHPGHAGGQPVPAGPGADRGDGARPADHRADRLQLQPDGRGPRSRTRSIAGLAREDLFTVVSDHFLTDTARYADIVLPATTQLEQHDIMFSWGHLYVTLNAPGRRAGGRGRPQHRAVPPARGGGWASTTSSSARTDEEMIAEAYDWSAPAMEGITLESLRETGWARLNLPIARRVRPARRRELPDAVRARPSSGPRCAEQAGNFVVPLFRQLSNEYQPGGHRRPAAALRRRRARPARTATG